MSEIEEEPAPAITDPNLAMVPGVELDVAEKHSAAPGVELQFQRSKRDEAPDIEIPRTDDSIQDKPSNTTFTVPAKNDAQLPDVPDVVYSTTPDVVPLRCDATLATDVKDEIPPNSPGASSLSASLKFLESSHLLSYDEMVGMGCQPSKSNEVNVDASGSSSLLTESLLNMSLPDRQAVKPMSPQETTSAGDRGDAQSRGGLVARPPSAHSDVTSSVDTGYHGGESEAPTSPVGSVDSNLTRSKAATASEVGESAGNLTDTVPQVTKMEAVEELTERSVSEADLTMREEEADASSDVGGPSLVSLSAATVASKKKRTRSPTPSSAKTESVPAKRSLTQQRQTGASGSRLSNPSPASRRSSGSFKSGSTLSVSERSGQASTPRSTAATRKSTVTSSTASLSRANNSGSSSSGASTARRASSSGTKASNGPSTLSSTAKSNVGARPRRSISGSSGNVGDTKKSGRDNADGGSQSTASQRRTSTSGSLSARSNAEESNKSSGSGSANTLGPASSSANGGPSRLKAPSTLNRTFSRKTAASSTANPTPTTPRSSTLRSSISSTSSSATVPSPATTAAARRRDSQLVRQPSLPKSARGPVASSTPHVDRSAPASSTQAANSKSRPVALTAAGDVKEQSDGKRKASISSDTKTASGRNTPFNELRDQLANQTAQLTAQSEQLATQTVQLTAQSEELAAQAEKIASQDSRISELKVQNENKTSDIVRTRSQLREAVYSFDIMAIVCQNTDSRWKSACQQIDVLSVDLSATQENLQQAEIHINALMSENKLMEEEIGSANERHEEEMDELHEKHKVFIKAERLKFKEEKEIALDKLVEQQSAEVKTLKRYHEKEMDHAKTHADMRMKELKTDYEMRLYRNTKIHENELTELQHQHEKKVAEITHRFEEMKVALTERVNCLHAEGSDLKSKANQYEENIRRNSDVKLQAVIQQFQHLPEENASLKAVLDLRINENAELRRQNTELQGKLGQLDEAREKQEQLLRQIENLEAIISLKTDNEKQLHDKHQQLLRRYERESKEKKRLSMNYDELLYKLEERQSTDDLTKSSLSDLTSMTSSAVIVRPRTEVVASRQRHRGLQHDRSKRRTIASSRELDP